MSELVQNSKFKEHCTSSKLSAKDIYFAFLNPCSDVDHFEVAQQFLSDKIEQARCFSSDMPSNRESLHPWLLKRSSEVGDKYSAYLAGRKAGAPRKYFSNKSHALYFLKGVAPTKLVDGAWLYGLLPHWKDTRCLPLIRTYLEELGDGDAEKNHVVLYQKLLEIQGCDNWQDLTDPYFVQGAIQLCMAHAPENFLPEIIGYNLGYEQLPLHLLITAYELNELGIDPYYFTLHITTDNAENGHAFKALQGLWLLKPLLGDTQKFYQRVLDGYRLNELGACTTSVIESFDIEKEVVDLFKRKAKVGKNMHSDYCRVGGRTINDWLAQPKDMPVFLDALTETGWFAKGKPAQESRFWKLIQGDHAEMFGVFNNCEQQLLRDWIEQPTADKSVTFNDVATHEKKPNRVPSFRAKLRAQAFPSNTPPRSSNVVNSRLRNSHAQNSNDFTDQLWQLEEAVAGMPDKDSAMHMLINLMSPNNHHTQAGLKATRMFKNMLF